MYEYVVPEDQHINLNNVSLGDMLDLTIGILGDLSAGANIENVQQDRFRFLFSAQYFSALVESKAISHSDILLKLLGSSSYYLSDYPGSSRVVLNGIRPESIESLSTMEKILFHILERSALPNHEEFDNDQKIKAFKEVWNSFIQGNNNLSSLNESLTQLRKSIYDGGSDKNVLLVDVIRILVLKRFSISARNILTEYSDAEISLWNPYLTREHSLKEFWPAQVRLAQHGVFRGESAVVQMPTSAGKTRASELIVRSLFLANRGSLAVVVAPFRSLCQEIYNDFMERFSADTDVEIGLVSDVQQNDFEFVTNNQKSVLILTPEKLDFLLRHNRDLSAKIRLIIYDEGHMFDDAERGVKYELLLSSLKQQLSISVQIILISAVISNASEIKEWLMHENGILIDGKDLSPTNRSIAFAEWSSGSRRLQFVDENDINSSLFWVPTVLQSHKLEKRPGERVERYYPKADRLGKYQASQVAGFLGCRLAISGLTAVFSGKKNSAQKIIRELVEAYDRKLPIPQPINFSENAEQAQKVICYLEKTLGKDSDNTKAAKMGILVHHGNIPQGLRLVTEYALQKSQFKTVVCTSTLAQGVNLPIRYLVVANDRQGKDKIKTRDFHNLMGRAGRSGKYTEGTIIFANPDIYKARTSRGRAWHEVSLMLNSNNSEPSKSRLHILLTTRPADDIEKQKEWDRDSLNCRREICSYLMSALADIEDIREAEQIITMLCQNTLGYFELENDEQKSALVSIFLEIGLDIIARVPDINQRNIFAKSILDLNQIESFISSLQIKTDQIIQNSTEIEKIFEILWPDFYVYSKNKILKSFTEDDSLILCKKWISGDSFIDLLKAAQDMERVGGNTLHIEDIVNLCEGGFSYDVSTLMGSIAELCGITLPDEYVAIIKLGLSLLQKKLKYGLPGIVEATIYELGFSDRNLSMEIKSIIEETLPSVFRFDIKRSIKMDGDVKEKIESDYPEYFSHILNHLNN